MGKGKNSPVIGDNGVMTKAGDNAKYAGVLATILSWEPVDKTDVAQLDERFVQFVNFCAENDVRITNQTAYLALGISKDEVYDWGNGHTRDKAHADFIKKVKAFCSAYRELLGAEGKLNPVTLVWWQKQYDGMVDKQELVLTPNTQRLSDSDYQEIAEKYKQLPTMGDDEQVLPATISEILATIQRLSGDYANTIGLLCRVWGTGSSAVAQKNRLEYGGNGTIGIIWYEPLFSVLSRAYMHGR